MYVSYSGNASGAPASSDFDASAQCGINWLAEMWDDNTQTLGRVEFVHQDNLLLGQDWRQSFGCSLSVCVLQDQHYLLDSKPHVMALNNAAEMR
jgi:hypothetical protein